MYSLRIVFNNIFTFYDSRIELGIAQTTWKLLKSIINITCMYNDSNSGSKNSIVLFMNLQATIGRSVPTGNLD